jgi:hypothetical protein
MSNRKRRGRSADAAGEAQQLPPRDPEGQPAPSHRAPQRNVAMLSVSIVTFLVWISFLLYVALFG